MRKFILLMGVSMPVLSFAAELPVVSVTLSNAGLAQVERRGEVPANGNVTFTVPTTDVDDILKSLQVFDSVASVGGIRLPALDAASEAFRGLPLSPRDFQNRVTLLKALLGQMVEVGGVQGQLADAEETEAARGPDGSAITDGGLRVTILTETGISTVVLREGGEVKLLDAALAARVRRAAEALAAARAADTRQIEVALNGGERAREVQLVTVTGAPLWKPSYRLMIPATAGEATLNGWAVVENRSGADWGGVRLSLVSGNPAAYRQALYQPIMIARPNIPVRAAGSVNVVADTGEAPPPPAPAAMAAAQVMQQRSRDATSQNSGAFAERAYAVGVAAPAPEPLAQIAAAQAESSIGRVAFTLPAPVTVRSGETANVPFLNVRLPAERVWWVQNFNARNPLLAVRVRNTSGHTLPDGLATVYGADGAEAGAYLGDSEIRAMPDGTARVLAYGRDRDVAMSFAQHSSQQPTSVTLQRGIVQVRYLQREEYAFTIDPRGVKGRMIIDLPNNAGAKPTFEVASTGDYGLRYDVELDGSQVTLRPAYERDMMREYPLWTQNVPLARIAWRDIDIERAARNLPGGPGTLENFREILTRLPAGAPGRDKLAGVIRDMEGVRAAFDDARTAIVAVNAAENGLDRLRQAVEDRTGPAREEARRRLNEASTNVERLGGIADTAWENWRRKAQALLAREG